ncbi:pyridoxal-phosphate dependent enzyme [Picrophilus oshimae]|uniref:Cysteine synthase n=1 Tax=Picrophilus torridus (strain ATCC 700027 / DSM 9790 / JCM 10055 / NBRC 100828 / KAW 2/3) TaxID=1122961 RepID=Q6L0G4_PICTO|nr:pyridoxal-phosphate dependent enzyme [Picrophilus oshimae]AAT43538.1 cysteine synthase [Picrophilus oshimae DSM 9789]SMD30150.1 cysteine synthase [Picrophilus oshimae DSM 9789]
MYSISGSMYSYGIGNTPLLNLDGIYAKAEYKNKFGSIKDRAAFFMISSVMDKIGNKIIVEASSGNTGIAVAGISRELGIKSIIVIPEGASDGTKAMLSRIGVDYITTPGNSTEQSIKYVENLIKSDPQKYLRLNQHSNDMNYLSHYMTTAPEIEHDMGKPDTIVIGIGTGGTISGISKYFKEKYHDVKVIGIIPDENSRIFGLRNPFLSVNHGIIDKNINYIDDVFIISEDAALKGVSELLSKYNLFCRPLVGC